NPPSTAGIREVMYSNVLLATGRANPASAKPVGPGGGVSEWGQADPRNSFLGFRSTIIYRNMKRRFPPATSPAAISGYNHEEER
ncbi:MAG: hypothetical protein Q7T80_12220, partial [Methanoregula sp.]|nr:hypothetical protein [Methanoregula sp.]